MPPRAPVNKVHFMQNSQSSDAIIIGAGFSGLYLLHKLRELGLSVVVFERGGDVGGTWYWNRYPGARCDIESTWYSYSFSPELEREWKWSQRYAKQEEILAYAGHVADRFALRPFIRFNTRVDGAHYDEQAQAWVVQTDAGTTHRAPLLFAATGPLSDSNVPPLPGLNTFAGEIHHTGAWPHQAVDFAGKRVGIVGTGSSGVQTIPMVARQAAQTFVFQRTPQFVLPAEHREVSEAESERIRSDYAQLRALQRSAATGFWANPGPHRFFDVSPEERAEELERRWKNGGFAFLQAFTDMLTNEKANVEASAFVKRKIRDAVTDPEIAARLTPTFALGARRPVLGDRYYETFNHANVTLVDLKQEPIVGLTADGLSTSQHHFPLDAIVFATGFDALTGAILKLNLKGRGGVTIQDAWTDGPKNTLGFMVHGFPNFFMLAGPGSPAVRGCVITSTEQQVDWLADCVAHMRRHRLATIESTAQSDQAWVETVNEAAGTTLTSTVDSWYLGSNIPGKPRVFMPYSGGFGVYRDICDNVARSGYERFTFSKAPAAATAEQAAPSC